MLLKDCKEQREQVVSAWRQGQLDSHLQPILPKEVIPPYSDDLFREATIQWLINADQPIAALEHPSFRNMVNITSRVTSGVKIPNQKATHCGIIDMFKGQMRSLHTWLLVGSPISLVWYSDLLHA